MRSFDSIESSPQEDVTDDKKETTKMSDDPDSTDSAKNAQKDQDSHAEEQLKGPSPDHSAICISDSEGDSPICLSSSVSAKNAQKDQDSHAEEQLKGPSPDHSAICISDSEGDSPICLSSSVQEKSAEPSPVKRPSDNEDTKSNKIINV